jgi:hypothetical protein
MSRIVIEVDEQVAKAFLNAGKARQGKMNEAINAMLKKIVNDASSGNYKQMLDQISDEAEKEGLTQELLNELLASHD